MKLPQEIPSGRHFPGVLQIPQYCLPAPLYSPNVPVLPEYSDFHNNSPVQYPEGGRLILKLHSALYIRSEIF